MRASLPIACQRTLLVLLAVSMAAIAEGGEPKAPSALTDLGASLDSYEAFQKAVGPHVVAHWQQSPPYWQSRDKAPYWFHIEPSVYHFLRYHAAHVRSLSVEQQSEFLAALVNFIARKRQEAGKTTVIGRGRPLIALLDPEEDGLRQGQVEGVASAYGAPARVFKGGPDGEPAAKVGNDFLKAVRSAAASEQPATIVILAHGLKTQIPSYSLGYQDLVEALLAGAAERGTSDVQLGHLLLIVDACYGADLVMSLGQNLEDRVALGQRTLDSLPWMVSSVNRDRVGFARVGPRFVSHFWGDAVIQLFYVNKPRPTEITLCDFMQGVDSKLYGYGRRPEIINGRLLDWKLVEPNAVQDPVFFAPLKPAEVDELRRLLGLPSTGALPASLDIG